MIGRMLKRFFAPLAGASLAFGAPAHAQQAMVSPMPTTTASWPPGSW